MTSKLRAIRDITKENVDYVAGILGIGYAIVDIGSKLYSGFYHLTIYYKATGIIFIFLLIYIFFRNFKKVFADITFSLNVEESLYNAEKEAKLLVAKNLINFRNIIPTTKVLKHLYALAFSEAKRSLDSSCFLTRCELRITYSQNSIKSNTKKFDISVKFDFFSPKKKISIIQLAQNLKLHRGKPEFSYEETGRSIEPFFHNRFWRDAVIEACERTEVHLLTRKDFSISLLGYALYDIYILFLRENALSKNYSYAFLNNKLYEGSSDGRLIKDFSLTI